MTVLEFAELVLKTFWYLAIIGVVGSTLVAIDIIKALKRRLTRDSFRRYNLRPHRPSGFRARRKALLQRVPGL